MSRDERREALDSITALIRRFDLNKEDLIPCLKEAGIDLPVQRNFRVALQYLGGVFLFASIAVFIGMYWNSLSDSSRVALTLGAGVICYALSWLYDSRQIATVLLLMAAPLEPTGMLIFMDTYLSVPGSYVAFFTSLVFFVMALQFFVAYFHRSLPVLLNGIILFILISYCFFFKWLDNDLKLNLSNDLLYLSLGLGLMSATFLLRHSFHSPIVSEGWFALSGLFLFPGLHEMVQRSMLEPIYALVTILCVCFAIDMRSLLLSIVSLGALLFYLGSLTNRMFDDVIAWPISLALLGLGCFWLQSVWRKGEKKGGKDTQKIGI